MQLRTSAGSVVEVTPEMYAKYGIHKEVVINLSWKQDKLGGGVSKQTAIINKDDSVDNTGIRDAIAKTMGTIKSIVCPHCPQTKHKEQCASCVKNVGHGRLMASTQNYWRFYN